MIFVNAIGLVYRTDRGLTKPTSWTDLADPKYAGLRGGYQIPVNSLGQAHLLMLGKIYGSGYQDLDADVHRSMAALGSSPAPSE